VKSLLRGAEMLCQRAVAAAAQGWPIILGRGEYLIVPDHGTGNLARLRRGTTSLGAGDREVEDPYRGPEITWRWPLPEGGNLAAVAEPKGTRGYSDLLRSAHSVALAGTVVDVASLPDLIRMADASPCSHLHSFMAALWATLEQIERAGPDALLG